MYENQHIFPIKQKLVQGRPVKNSKFSDIIIILIFTVFRQCNCKFCEIQKSSDCGHNSRQQIWNNAPLSLSSLSIIIIVFIIIRIIISSSSIRLKIYLSYNCASIQILYISKINTNQIYTNKYPFLQRGKFVAKIFFLTSWHTLCSIVQKKELEHHVLEGLTVSIPTGKVICIIWWLMNHPTQVIWYAMCPFLSVSSYILIFNRKLS